jgi:hypothetical protein
MNTKFQHIQEVAAGSGELKITTNNQIKRYYKQFFDLESSQGKMDIKKP